MVVCVWVCGWVGVGVCMCPGEGLFGTEGGVGAGEGFVLFFVGQVCVCVCVCVCVFVSV